MDSVAVDMRGLYLAGGAVLLLHGIRVSIHLLKGIEDIKNQVIGSEH